MCVVVVVVVQTPVSYRKPIGRISCCTEDRFRPHFFGAVEAFLIIFYRWCCGSGEDGAKKSCPKLWVSKLSGQGKAWGDGGKRQLPIRVRAVMGAKQVLVAMNTWKPKAGKPLI